MDEHTLNDLLECSVCLERLDTSSKVLPCQHTFCRKCLEVIISSHNELRCPECRILVDIKVDELPPNVLLMRILEGMKQSASIKTQPDNKLEEQLHSNDQLRQQHRSERKQQPNPHVTLYQRQQPQQPNLVLQRQRCLLPHAYALFDFVPKEATDLKFKKGDVVLLKRKIDSNWYVGQVNGQEGSFPINYVKVIVPLPTPQCVALYDFKMGPNEEEGCLNFKKGSIIHVLRRVDHNWAEGRIGTTIGIFPIAFVELNALAKQLLESAVILPGQQHPKHQYPPHHVIMNNSSVQQQLQTRYLPPIPLIDPTESNSSTSSSNATSPNSNSISDSSTSSNSTINNPNTSLPNTPQHNAIVLRNRDGREKRHSLNALLLSGAGAGQPPALSLLQSNRHSAEILSIPNELSIASNSTNVPSSRSRSAGNETSNSLIPSTSSIPREQLQSASTTTSNPHTRVNVLKSSSQLNITLPWGYLALYPYKPRKNDELELKKGCVYIVTERCLDGWFKGKNWQDISGVFPGNYVTPLRNRDHQQLMHQLKCVPLVNNSNQSTINQAMPINIAKSQNRLENMNAPLNSLLPNQPPDLPPRQISDATTSCSVWTKPLSQTVEAFFNRNKLSQPTNSAASTITNSQQPAHYECKEKDTKQKDSPNTSTTSGAVGLMKRLAHMKSRSKSPNSANQNHSASAQPTHNLNFSIDNQTFEETQASHSHPVHVRSGSCPSQLLQNLPIDNNTTTRTDQTKHNSQQQQQSMPTVPPATVSYGSQRIKGNKERPHLLSARQSLDAATFRSIYNNTHSSSPPLPPAAACSHLTSTVVSNSNLTKSAQQQQQQQLQNQTHANMIIPNHRKSQSLDAANILSTNCTTMLTAAAVNISEAAIKASATTKSTQNTRESRFRCVVPYPPNSDIELELHVGDIIYVQRKQKNGWYKGTHARTNRTGLFPASFVEPDI